MDSGSHPSPSSPIDQALPGGTAESDSREHSGPALELRDPPGEEHAPSSEAAPTSTGQVKPTAESLRDRFMSQPPAPGLDADGLNWEAADCGCVPVLSSFETYGLDPFWAKQDVGPVNFGIWSRIGYYALTPNETGGIQPPAGWMDKRGKEQAALVPHRYGTKVDLVISNNKWAALDPERQGLALDTSYVLIELVDSIVALVSEFGFDGVTIDFNLSQFLLPKTAVPQNQQTKDQRKDEKIKRKYVQSYVLFMKQLDKALKAKNEELRLHAVLEYYKDETNGKLPRPFTKAELRELNESVDLLLFIPHLDDGTQLQAMKQYDDYFADYEYGEVATLEKKLVFILDTDDAALHKELADIRSDRFGGVGGWMLHKQIAVMMTDKLTDAAFMQSRDYVERFDSDPLPGRFCKLVCPNRSILVSLVVALTAVYVGAFLLSFFSPVVGSLIHQHLQYAIAGAVLILFLSASLFLCVPVWSAGWQTEFTLLLVALAGGYAVKTVMDKRREATYP